MLDSVLFADRSKLAEVVKGEKLEVSDWMATPNMSATQETDTEWDSCHNNEAHYKSSQTPIPKAIPTIQNVATFDSQDLARNAYPDRERHLNPSETGLYKIGICIHTSSTSGSLTATTSFLNLLPALLIFGAIIPIAPTASSSNLDIKRLFILIQHGGHFLGYNLRNLLRAG